MNFSISPQTLRFKQPAGTSRGVYLERRLWYVHLYDGLYHGIGECAPLFDLSCDYREDMIGLLNEACSDLVATGSIDYKKYCNCPSVLFALETALLSLEGSRRGNALRLFDNAFTRSEMGIPINGLVWMGTYEEMLARMEEKLALGFRCIKIKIGAIEFDREVALLRHLRERFPVSQVQLRVDANGGFAPHEAMEKLRILASLDIHSIEQPIRQHQWDAMAELCRETPIPIALDEELIGVNDPDGKCRLLDTIRPRYIILKPTLHGGLCGCEEWMALARQRNIGYWVTSALESNVGLNAIAQWVASSLNGEKMLLTAKRNSSNHGSRLRFTSSPLEKIREGLFQGLGTGQLFETNYESTDLEIQGDKLWFTSAKQREFQAEADAFISEWQSDSTTLEVQTSGSTGTPKAILVEKQRMEASARATIRFLGLLPGDTALLCMPLRYIAGKMVVVRTLVGQLRLITVAPSSRPFRTLTVSPSFAAITPQQAVESLRHPHDASIMRGVRQLIIGGGAIPAGLAAQLSTFPNAVWSTYGMTETLSHIAMRRLNEQASSYTPLPGVTVSLSPDGCLQIYAPAVNPQHLVTNDLARILADGTFVILGRKDNVVCSGGIKLQIEDIEEKLRPHLVFPFVLTSVTDPVLGEALAMLYEGVASPVDVKAVCLLHLDRYEVPRYFLPVPALPLTGTGKPARNEARQLAASLMGN